MAASLPPGTAGERWKAVADETMDRRHDITRHTIYMH